MWPILATVVVPPTATYWRLATLGYLKPSEHRDDFAIHGRLRQQPSWEPRSHLALSGHWGLGVYIRGCDGPCGLEVCGWYVGIYLGPINMHIKPYIGNCGTCGMGINPRIRGYLHLRCQNRGAVHATTSNTYFRTINTHDMPVALSYFPSG